MQIRQRRIDRPTEFPMPALARVLGIEAPAGHVALEAARERVKQMASADILIIEDEPIIAMDLDLLVKRCGHRVIGIAGSETQAVKMALAERPSLILADINLGRGGDGSRAVSRILRMTEDSRIPVIFVTALIDDEVRAKNSRLNQAHRSTLTPDSAAATRGNRADRVISTALQ